MDLTGAIVTIIATPAFLSEAFGHIAKCPKVHHKRCTNGSIALFMVHF